MKIRTRLYISTLLSVIVSLIIGTTLYNSSLQLKQANKKNENTKEIIRNIFQLDLLNNEYILHPSERIKFQWFKAQELIRESIKNQILNMGTEVVLLNNLIKLNAQEKEIFIKL